MGPSILIVAIIFATIFGIFYLFISSRHKERLSLIEKGADASIFYGNRKRTSPIWKIFVVNLATLLMGIGLGVLLAGILSTALNMKEEVVFPGMIFLTAGLGLFAGFQIARKLD
ncbi:DUF6249 domain-containing protein [Robertkochia solimangrovi]|uniref:DUF6249 domain-containing protein n=1 Tax=Robertkochia solimangrovi TaxID=2213046 RepID=UPI0011804FE8|nr:DUF6249 domain-containing protein [Robertkochia solimangrovi]TRZ42813.1 hypothetical protein DMZ48_12140 [Robertkochia solimangrovi]